MRMLRCVDEIMGRPLPVGSHMGERPFIGQTPYLPCIVCQVFREGGIALDPNACCYGFCLENFAMCSHLVERLPIHFIAGVPSLWCALGLGLLAGKKTRQMGLACRAHTN
jgi:hypothetical protein